jgi:hypothetical protein
MCSRRYPAASSVLNSSMTPPKLPQDTSKDLKGNSMYLGFVVVSALVTAGGFPPLGRTSISREGSFG